MPAKSRAQQHLMAAAEHGATFPMATKLRASMTHSQLHDFASGSEAGKPAHVKAPAAMPKMRHAGYTESSHQGNVGRKPIMRHGS